MNSGSGLRLEHTYDIAAVEAAAAHEQALAEQAQAASFAAEAVGLRQQDGMLRRTVVRDVSLVVVAATVAPPSWMSRVKNWATGTLKDVLSGAGRALDEYANTERIIPGPTISLAPRKDNTPSVEPKPRGESVTTWTSFSPQTEKERATLRFAPALSAEAEHFPHQDLRLGEGVFTEGGFAIITTAEGFTPHKTINGWSRGEQVSTRMFQDHTTGQLVAVGLEGGLYVYKTELGRKGVTSGEWVRIVTRPDKNAPPSALISAKTWAEMQQFMPKRFFAQDKELGVQTLRQVGYKPFGAISPNTKTPDTKTLTISPENCTTDPANSIDKRLYWITEKGDLIDMNHLGSKARETLRLVLDLLSLDPEDPTVRVEYARGYSSGFEFAIDPDALKLENVVDMASSIMDTVTTLMEGISQRGVYELNPDLQKHFKDSHFSFEDGPTNKLGSTGMLGTITQLGILKDLNARLKAELHRNPHLSKKEVIDNLVRDSQPSLMRITLGQLVAEHGVRKQTTTITQEFPLNPYHEIPGKVTSQDLATPTFIDVRKAGINPDNPDAHRYRPTNVAMLELIANEAGRKLTR